MAIDSFSCLSDRRRAYFILCGLEVRFLGPWNCNDVCRSDTRLLAPESVVERVTVPHTAVGKSRHTGAKGKACPPGTVPHAGLLKRSLESCHEVTAAYIFYFSGDNLSDTASNKRHQPAAIKVQNYAALLISSVRLAPPQSR